MRTIASKLQSHRLAVFEALVDNDETGLTIPDVVRISGVPKSTVHRVLADYLSRRIVRIKTRKGKAAVFCLNSADDEVVEIARAVNQYSLRRAELEGLTHGVSPAGPPPESIEKPVVVQVINYASKPQKSLQWAEKKLSVDLGSRR